MHRVGKRFTQPNAPTYLTGDHIHQGLSKIKNSESSGVMKADIVTERHLDLFSDTFYAHEREGDKCNNRYCRPAQIFDHSERKGEEV